MPVIITPSKPTCLLLAPGVVQTTDGPLSLRRQATLVVDNSRGEGGYRLTQFRPEESLASIGGVTFTNDIMLGEHCKRPFPALEWIQTALTRSWYDFEENCLEAGAAVPMDGLYASGIYRHSRDVQNDLEWEQRELIWETIGTEDVIYNTQTVHCPPDDFNKLADGIFLEEDFRMQVVHTPTTPRPA